MIEAYLGLPGDGKTMFLVRKILRTHKMYEAVYANFHLDEKRVPNFRLLEDRMQLVDLMATDPKKKKILVCIDEAYTWFDARLFAKVPPELLAKFGQTRKSGFNLMWTAQDESQVDKRLKIITTYFHECRAFPRDDTAMAKILGCRKPLIFFVKRFSRKEFATLTARKKKKGAAVYKFSRRVASAYDTYEKVQSAVASEGGK